MSKEPPNPNVIAHEVRRSMALGTKVELDLGDRKVRGHVARIEHETLPAELARRTKSDPVILTVHFADGAWVAMKQIMRVRHQL